MSLSEYELPEHEAQRIRDLIDLYIENGKGEIVMTTAEKLIEQGLEQGIEITAQKMLPEGLSEEIIFKTTGLDSARLETLKRRGQTKIEKLRDLL